MLPNTYTQWRSIFVFDNNDWLYALLDRFEIVFTVTRDKIWESRKNIFNTPTFSVNAGVLISKSFPSTSLNLVVSRLDNVATVSAPLKLYAPFRSPSPSCWQRLLRHWIKVVTRGTKFSLICSIESVAQLDFFLSTQMFKTGYFQLRTRGTYRYLPSGDLSIQKYASTLFANPR